MYIKERTQYIISSVILIVIVILLANLFILRKKNNRLLNENTIMGINMSGMLDEYAIAQVNECRNLTENVMLHKAYLDAYRDDRDNCVDALADKGISYDDLDNPMKHYQVTGSLVDGFNINDIDVNIITEDNTTQEHVASQPVK